MIFPTTISTIASALSIIDYMIRFSKYLSPDIRHALLNAKKEVSQLDTSASISNANSIIFEKLETTLPNHLLEVTLKDISHATKAIQLFEKGTKQFDGNLPDLYSGLNNMIVSVGQSINSWGCFDAWGQTFSTMPDYDKSKITLVPAPYVSKSISKIKSIKRTLVRSLRNSNWYFDADWDDDRSLFSVGGSLITTGGKYVHLKHYDGSIEQILEYSSLAFGGYAAELGTYTNKDIDNREFRLSNSEVELLASGLIRDVIDYSRRVRGEIITTKELSTHLSKLAKIHGN